VQHLLLRFGVWRVLQRVLGGECGAALAGRGPLLRRAERAPGDRAPPAGCRALLFVPTAGGAAASSPSWRTACERGEAALWWWRAG